jgi:arginine decarboxylase-like protein
MREDMQDTSSATRVLDRLLEPIGRCLSKRAARELASLRADEEVQAHIRELAEKCNEGILSVEERAEYEACVMAANVVAILQAKARNRLRTDS